MSHSTVENQGAIEDTYFKKLYRRHYRGALVRSGASIVLWCSALFAYFLNIIKCHHLTGVSVFVLYLVLMNLPALYTIKSLRSRKIVRLFSLLIHLFEVIGYTGVIYFLGGIEATYLVPIYAILISYLGVTASRNMPFFVAGLCSICYSLMVLADYFGIIPHQAILHEHHFFPFKNQLIILLVVIALLYVVAFTSSYTANLLKRSREKLRSQNEELIGAKTVAEEASQTKSMFLANMSHELRTPLNHIIGFTELIADKKVGDLNETQEEYLNDVLLSGRHLLSLINDILDLSKIEAGKLELEPTDVNLKEVLENSLIMIKEKALKHGIQLSTDIDVIPETIWADERKLKQILYNLLSNAAKFTPDGGEVCLTGRMVDCTVRSGFRQGDSGEFIVIEHCKDRSEVVDVKRKKCIEVSVSDTGIGINPEDLERIFDPFEQVEHSASRRYQGTGLGLSLTKNLVELHGGLIWARSEGDGKGCTFSFILPLRHPSGSDEAPYEWIPKS